MLCKIHGQYLFTRGAKVFITTCERCVYLFRGCLFYNISPRPLNFVARASVVFFFHLCEYFLRWLILYPFWPMAMLHVHQYWHVHIFNREQQLQKHLLIPFTTTLVLHRLWHCLTQLGQVLNPLLFMAVQNCCDLIVFCGFRPHRQIGKIQNKPLVLLWPILSAGLVVSGL